MYSPVLTRLQKTQQQKVKYILEFNHQNRGNQTMKGLAPFWKVHAVILSESITKFEFQPFFQL